MATIKAFIRTTANATKEVNIRFRLTDGRAVQLAYKSEIKINPAIWDAKNECVKKRVVCPDELRMSVDSSVTEIKTRIENYYMRFKSVIDSKMLTALMNGETVDERPKKLTFFECFNLFLERGTQNNRSEKVLAAILSRYQSYQRISKKDSSFVLEIDTLDHHQLAEIEKFIASEHVVCKKYPQLYSGVRAISQRSANTISAKMKVVRTFMRWCLKAGYTENRPFDRYSVRTERYGTPYYISLEERDRIADFPIESRSMATQRDIFIFQCLIGCRVSDLLVLKPENVVNGFLEYIPQKTNNESVRIVRVPLSQKAMELIERYNGVDKKGRLFPFITSQQYNRYIKKIFQVAGINRKVGVVNPLTGKEEFHPLYEVASSHIARRTFIGNLYKKVKDPNLIGSLSGHVEGSKAFARYRTIDDDIKKELIDLIE